MTRLRCARKAKNLTQQKMANFVGVELRSYQRYESGDSEPSYATLVVLADHLDVPTDFLLGRDDYLKSLGVHVDLSQESPPKHPKRQLNL